MDNFPQKPFFHIFHIAGITYIQVFHTPQEGI